MKNYSIVFLLFFTSCSISNISRQNSQNIESQESSAKVSFYLTNTSSESIPLLIPSVMNPNLSPNSSSAVVLSIGQQVYFKYKGKKYILIEVDKSIKKGDKIEVSELLKKRKEELGLK
ncbi:hypothetical protein OAD28_01595 [Flavobacteriales bacterium]|mgnify:FL=1|jgi:hypothetical protein|nr:hypothetical protein [Flavobacteriales bacterium]